MVTNLTKNSATPTNLSKNSATPTNLSKNSASASNLSMTGIVYWDDTAYTWGSSTALWEGNLPDAANAMTKNSATPTNLTKNNG